MNAPVRVRFAPSPTGNLHVGGARTAIYNWAFARRFGGRFILRIEDTDPERSTTENIDQIVRALRWLGLDWDEGPEVGGDFGPYRQTERQALYDAGLARLQSAGAVYPCFCSKEELTARRVTSSENSSGGPSGYDRHCRNLSTAEAARRIQAGDPHTWRLKLALEHDPVMFTDAVFGRVSVPFAQLDDFILVRSDGTPTYNFAAVIDDAQMQISHVIRGDDHLSNTPKQILLYEALGLEPPVFAHLSMILGSDGSRLSKRHGATSVEAFRDSGYLPAALLNYLALLGWSLDGQTTLLNAELLCANFSLERVSKNPATFDQVKLDWVNAAYIKELGAAAFIDALTPWLAVAGYSHDELVATPEEVVASIQNHRAWYESIYPLIAERVKNLAEAIPMIAYLFSGSTAELDDVSIDKCLRLEGIGDALQAVIASLEDPELPWQAARIETALRQLPERLGLKPKLLFQAVRVAICGNMVSPPLFESLELIGRTNSLERLRTAWLITL